MEMLMFLGGVFCFLVLPIMVFQLYARVRRLEEQLDHLQFSDDSSKRLVNKSFQGEEKTVAKHDEEVERESSVGASASIPVKLDEKESIKPPPIPEVDLSVSDTSAFEEVEERKEVVIEEREAEADVVEERPNTVEVWLERMGLKPPRADEEGTNPMAWWSTRIGLAFGVIAAVFLGLYVNQNTVRWVRLLELVVVAIAVFGAGCWFERKLQGFGRALSAGGLSLLYVAAYAAYGLPAMKIIESPFLGTLAQVVALVLTVSWALWKSRETIFGLALVLGYVTCAFAAAEGLDPVPVIALLILSAAGATLFAWRGWWSGLWGAVLGSGLGLAILAVLTWSLGRGPSQGVGMVTMLTLTILPLVALSWQWLTGETKAKRVIPAVTSIGLLSGALVSGVRGFDFEIFYASFAGLFILAGWWWRRDEGEGLWQTLWAKAMVLVALFVIARFEGPVRGFSLLAQAGGLIWLSRTRSRVVFEVGAGLAFLVGWFFLRADTVEPWNWKSRGFLLAYLVVSQGLLVWYRFLGGEDSIRKAVGVILAILIALQVVQVGCGGEERLWFFLIPFAFGVLSLLQRWPLKLQDAEWTPFVILMGTLWMLSTGFAEELPVSGQMAVWLMGAIGFYGWLGRSEKPVHLLVSISVLLGSLVAYGILIEELLEMKWLGAFFAMLAVVTLVLGRQLNYLTLRCFSILTGIVGAGWCWILEPEGGLRIVQGVGLLMSVVWWFWGWRRPEEKKVHEDLVEGVRTVVSGVWLVVFLNNELADLPRALVFGVVSAGLMLGWRFLRAYSLSWLGLLFSLMGVRSLFEESAHLYYPWVVAFYFVLFLGQGIWLAHAKQEITLARPKVASVLWGGTAMGVILFGLVMRSEVASWTTASWAIASVILLASGFWFGLRGYRMIALGGLAATIIRMFMVDIQDSFWRILAFGITGALLVGIGYLYNRFHKRLADGDLDWGMSETKELSEMPEGEDEAKG